MFFQSFHHVRKIVMDDYRPSAKFNQPAAGKQDRLWIHIESHQPAVRRAHAQNRLRVAAAADGSIDIDSSLCSVQVLENLIDEYRRVIVIRHSSACIVTAGESLAALHMLSALLSKPYFHTVR